MGIFGWVDRDSLGDFFSFGAVAGEAAAEKDEVVMRECKAGRKWVEEVGGVSGRYLAGFFPLSDRLVDRLPLFSNEERKGGFWIVDVSADGCRGRGG